MRRCVLFAGNAVELISTTSRERAALENTIKLLDSVMHDLLTTARQCSNLTLRSSRELALVASES